MFTDIKMFIKKKMGQLLLEQGLINKSILSEALHFQRKFGGFLGNYLVRHGYVTEKDIVMCLSSQYGFPYLNLSNFKIEKEIINLIPARIAEKYSLIPIDKLGGIITIAIANPLDQEALKNVRLITGCEVQTFITTISDINAALETYYEIDIPDDMNLDTKPRLLNLEEYKGEDRRRFIRFKANIDIHFAYQDKYKKIQTKDISGGGVAFFSPNCIPVNTYLTLEINLPTEFSKPPIASVVRVVRVKEVNSKKRYEIGSMFVQLDPLDRKSILRYAKNFQFNNSLQY